MQTRTAVGSAANRTRIRSRSIPRAGAVPRPVDHGVRPSRDSPRSAPVPDRRTARRHPRPSRPRSDRSVLTCGSRAAQCLVSVGAARQPCRCHRRQTPTPSPRNATSDQMGLARRSGIRRTWQRDRYAAAFRRASRCGLSSGPGTDAERPDALTPRRAVLCALCGTADSPTPTRSPTAAAASPIRGARPAPSVLPAHPSTRWRAAPGTSCPTAASTPPSERDKGGHRVAQPPGRDLTVSPHGEPGDSRGLAHDAGRLERPRSSPPPPSPAVCPSNRTTSPSSAVGWIRKAHRGARIRPRRDTRRRPSPR